MSNETEQREAGTAETRKESPVAVKEAVAADLPDPLQALDDDTAANADALLRQLADEEVDRLLTEPKNATLPPADPSPGPGEPRPVVEAASPRPDNRSAASIDVVPGSPPAPAAEAAFSAKPIDRPSEVPAAMTAAVEPAPPTNAEPLEADVQANSSPRGIEAPPAGPLVSTELADAIAEHEQREILGLDRVPLALRPLIWINRPFEGLSASTRELLGTIGLVTTVNALVVLLYVMLFRG